MGFTAQLNICTFVCFVRFKSTRNRSRKTESRTLHRLMAPRSPPPHPHPPTQISFLECFLKKSNNTSFVSRDVVHSVTARWAMQIRSSRASDGVSAAERSSRFPLWSCFNGNKLALGLFNDDSHVCLKCSSVCHFRSEVIRFM